MSKSDIASAKVTVAADFFEKVRYIFALSGGGAGEGRLTRR
jgi:hypothetical protein